ncbi:asparagine synthase (glutamine-hydrolyzing) [Shimazuella sp. AN120528]|uniref:asparagine synthase (glutamine-hydrolyzing) n=1 Tax=Shimazuella soli TaxID=1892854 RepID=UPI001F0E47C3|nr:asparagine synthase (glutamine-hydrolyzing) [Shimazuella soli]MCH5585561.1 asparagine synthase (glutamine-hydrolyzing) [Shimazuella soli]
MCGIAGWVDWSRDISCEHKIIDAMNQAIAPRGPDEEGKWLSEHIILANRRLVVVDPVGGQQPMIKNIGERRFVIVYNGEIYNMNELRQVLSAQGYDIHTTSDTELILLSYVEWGINCPVHLNGIFAFAIWDEQQQELFLARDRLGVKPLFYTQQTTSFLFASEIKSLLTFPQVQAEVDEQGLAELLIMAPARTPGIGVFRGISELKPGYSLVLNRKGIRKHRYWQLTSHHHTDSITTTINQIKELLFKSIRKQLHSDVPIGAMLSGGLDSSAIAVIAKKILDDKGIQSFPTFSVDYKDNQKYFKQNEFQFSEDTPWANWLAQQMQFQHHSVNINNRELIHSLNHATESRDLIGMVDFDASLYLFAREIKKKVKVVLSGECADELFGGYPWFQRPDLIQSPTFPWAAMYEKRIPFLSEEIVARITPKEYFQSRYTDALLEVPRYAGDNDKEARLREISYLCLTRSMPILLDRKDRMGMAFGLEIRVPYCDHHLVEYVWNIPWKIKMAGPQEKWLLRQALKGILPETIRTRKKTPYPKTHHPNYLRIMMDQMRDLLSQHDSPIFQLMNRKKMKAFLEQDLRTLDFPWFGQLLNTPSFLAYWLQLHHWLNHYKVKIL